MEHDTKKINFLGENLSLIHILNGRALSTIGEKEIASFRRQNLGFVFQDFNLLDTFTLQDNIFLPLVLAGKHFPEMQAKLLPLAQQLGKMCIRDRRTW